MAQTTISTSSELIPEFKAFHPSLSPTFQTSAVKAYISFPSFLQNEKKMIKKGEVIGLWRDLYLILRVVNSVKVTQYIFPFHTKHVTCHLVQLYISI